LQSSKQLKTVYYCKPPDDGRTTETYCGNNIRGGGGGGGEEEFYEHVNELSVFIDRREFLSYQGDYYLSQGIYSIFLKEFPSGASIIF
jgi:hypothetical protein